LISIILMAISAGIIFLLGLAHIVFTFWGPKLKPRDLNLQTAMENSNLVITSEISMWQAWIGFNASHSMGAMLFGLIFGYLATTHSELFFQSTFLVAVGLAMLGGLFFLAKTFWFRVPYLGITISLAFYVASLVSYHV